MENRNKNTHEYTDIRNKKRTHTHTHIYHVIIIKTSKNVEKISPTKISLLSLHDRTLHRRIGHRSQSFALPLRASWQPETD